MILSFPKMYHTIGLNLNKLCEYNFWNRRKIPQEWKNVCVNISYHLTLWGPRHFLDVKNVYSVFLTGIKWSWALKWAIKKLCQRLSFEFWQILWWISLDNQNCKKKKNTFSVSIHKGSLPKKNSKCKHFPKGGGGRPQSSHCHDWIFDGLKRSQNS